MSSEIMVPFQLGANGAIAQVSDPDSQVRLHVMSLVNTEPGERVVISNYGVPLTSLLFESHQLAEQGVYTDIEEAASYWEPGVTIQATIDDSQGDNDSTVLMNLSYSRNDSPALDGSTPTHTNTVVVGPGGVISQVVRG